MGNVSTTASAMTGFASPSPLSDLDVCCRAHDHCHHRIKTGGEQQPEPFIFTR